MEIRQGRNLGVQLLLCTYDFQFQSFYLIFQLRCMHLPNFKDIFSNTQIDNNKMEANSQKQILQKLQIIFSGNKKKILCCKGGNADMLCLFVCNDKGTCFYDINLEFSVDHYATKVNMELPCKI